MAKKSVFPARSIVLSIFFLILNFTLLPFSWARSWEYYIEYKAKAPLNKKQRLFLNLKEETRYKDGVNYYRKSFFGISKKLNSDLESALYYAFKEKKKNDWHTLHMFWSQTDYKKVFEKFALASSTKLERHCSQDAYRFREKLKFILSLNKKISFWLGDEGRIFSLFDNSYLGENEALCGLDFKFCKDFSLSAYYDLRRIKSAGDWQNTNCLRTVGPFLMLSFREI